MKKRMAIGGGAFITYIENEKFKHNRLTINFITEIKKDSAAKNALTALLLKLGSSEYINMTKLNQRLNELYGAILSSDVSLYGKYQVIDISIIAVDNRYAMENDENILRACARLLCSVVFNPIIFTEYFTEKMLVNEKNILEDIIKSEINDKQTYAIYKGKRQICGNEPYGLNKFGSIEDLPAITMSDIKDAYNELLQEAKIEFVFVGSHYDKELTDIFRSYLIENREVHWNVDCKVKERFFDGIKDEKEDMNLSQEKLVMGFDFSKSRTESDDNALRLFAYMFGNSSNSKLFQSIREKMQLCYYCAAHIDTMSELMLIEFGIDSENHDRTVAEVLNQLRLCQQGKIDDSELDEAKLALTNEICEVSNFVDMTEDWYTNQIITGKMLTPENQIININSVTKEEIVSAANKIRFCSVFGLN